MSTNKALKVQYQAAWYQKHKAAQVRRVMERRKRLMEEHKPKILNYLITHPCACGESDPVVLQFDHNDAEDKTGEIARMLYDGYSWERLLKEIDKCTVRCANCHSRRTANQFGYWKTMVG